MIPLLFRRLAAVLRQTSRHVVFRVGLLLVAVVTYATTGFLYFEMTRKPELQWWDALWWSMVSLTTIGYGDIFPETLGGRYLVAVPIMFFGIGLLGFVLTLLATAIIESKAAHLTGRARVRMNDHVLICNYASKALVLEFVDQLRAEASTRDVDILLVDEDLEHLPPELVDRGVRFIRGNPARAETLHKAGIAQARAALVSAKHPQEPSTDHTTLAILLAIESINAKVRTVAELVDPRNREFIERTRCDAIVCPGGFTSLLMVQEIITPGVQRVMHDLASTGVGQQVYLVPWKGGATRPLSGFGPWAREQHALVIGAQRGEQLELNPGDDHPVQPGDLVVVIARTRPADAT
jgi:voltage-gated potassium channel